MHMKVKTIPVQLLITVAILLILTAFMIAAQCSLGRYTSSFGGEVKFSPNAKEIFELNYDEWSTNQEEGIQTLSLSVTNRLGKSNSTSNDGVRIRVYVPDTDGLISTLRLNQNGEEYTASVVDVPEGTAAHKTYGAGQICCFYSADGEELVFEVPDSGAESFEATLIFADAETDTTGVEVIVETVNAQRKGGKRL